ncbi:MAG: BatD family protein [Roseimicrobium sp.]
MLTLAHGQAAPVLTATVQPAEIRPGGFATYTITIEGGQPDSAPELALGDGVEMASPSPGLGQQTTIINGVVRQMTTLSWQITASNAGEFTIPAQQIHIGGVPFQCNATKLTVKDSPGSASSQFDPIISLEVAKREFYVGEVVPITANVYLHRNTIPRRVGLIELPKESFAVQRFPLQGEEGSVVMGGMIYRALSFRSTVSALKQGQFKLGPATSEILLDVPTQGNNALHPFLAQMETRKMKPQSNDIDVTVLALPEQDKPPGFTGAVGDFEVNLTASPRDIAVGEPVSVEITVTGQGNFDTLTAPTLTEQGSWKLYPVRKFNFQSANAPANGAQQSIGFSQVVIPKAKVASLPPFEFSFFSPTQKKYITLRTQPVSLNVKAAEQPVEPQPATSGKTSQLNAAASDDKAPPVQPKVTDILTNLPGHPTWLATRGPLAQDGTFLRANLAAAGLLLLMIFGKLGFAAWRAHAQAPDAPVRRLWQQLQRGHELSTGAFYRLAAAYIEAQGLEDERVRDILDRNHAVNYGRPSDDHEKPITRDERASVLQTLKNAQTPLA